MRAQERQAQELRAQKHKTPRDQETKNPRQERQCPKSSEAVCPLAEHKTRKPTCR